MDGENFWACLESVGEANGIASEEDWAALDCDGKLDVAG